MDTIREIGIKTLYLADGREASSWVGGGSHTLVEFLTCSSGLVVKPSKKKCATNAIGYFINDSNSPYQNQLVYFMTLPPFSNNRSTPLTEGEGWRRAIALYAARKLVGSTWITQKDEYLVPCVYKDVG